MCLCLSSLAFGQDASSNSNTTPESDAPAWAIGLAVPLSGEYAPLGKQVRQAARLAARDAGVRLVAQDTKGTPVGAIEAVRALAEDDQVLCVLGPIGQHESRAAAQIAQRAGMPLLTLASVDAVNQVGNWVYRLRQSPAEQAAALAEAVRERLGDQKTAGIFFPESTYGRQAALAFAERFVALGGSVNAVASYPEDTSDFRKPLGALLGTRVWLGKRARAGKRRADADGYLRLRAKPAVDFDLLFIPDYHQRVARMLPFMPAAGIQTGEGGEGTAVQMLGLRGWQGSSMKLTGAHAAGAIYADVFAGPAEGGRAEDFARMFEGKTGRRPVDLDAQVFDATWMLGKLIERRAATLAEVSSKISPAKRRLDLANHLPRAEHFKGVSGELGFGPDGQPRRPIRLYQFDVEGTVTPWQ